MVEIYRKYWKSKKHNEYHITACGWFDYDGKLYDKERILDFVLQKYIIGNNDIYADALTFNGNFSIIVESKKEIILLVDRMRTYPIIYFFDNKDLVITDDIMKYREEYKPNFQVDEVSCEQFLSSNYIIGPYTIYKDVYSVQSGEVVTINISDKNISRKQYYQWAPNMEYDIIERDIDKEAKIQDEIFTRVFKRMIDSKPNVHNWIIPLSGGYDSRIIVNYLYKLGVKNVVCYTYGMNKNIQLEISRQVAEALGYKWYFVDYKEWTPRMQEDNILDEYIRFGFNGSSVAHLQDFPAVYALIKQNILHEGDMFVPGHALEVIAGNHLKSSMLQVTNSEEATTVLKSHYSGFGYYTQKREIVLKRFNDVLSGYRLIPIQLAECYDWKERQTKFIANSVKVYEFFNLDWRIPEWDNELMEYWDKIGFNYRIDRKMFKEVFKNKLSVEPIKNIPFANDILKKKGYSLRESLINFIPFKAKKILKKNGWYKSMYYAGEGLHLVYSNQNETITDYLKSYNAPYPVVKYLKSYYKNQKISDFDINGVTSLKNVRNSIL